MTRTGTTGKLRVMVFPRLLAALACAGAACLAAAAMSISIRRRPRTVVGTALPTDREEAAAAQAHG